MTERATIHGLEFRVEAQGFGRHERDRDLSIRRLWDMLEWMAPANAARLHAKLLSGTPPDQALSLCRVAVAMQCHGWHDVADLGLDLAAIPAPAHRPPEDTA